MIIIKLPLEILYKTDRHSGVRFSPDVKVSSVDIMEKGIVITLFEYKYKIDEKHGTLWITKTGDYTLD